MTAMKLTKTQREVLKRAIRKPNGRVYVQAWSCGSKSGGNREYAAMKQLVTMGLLERFSSSSHNGLGFGKSAWNNPHTTYSTEATAYITDAGRAALEG